MQQTTKYQFNLIEGGDNFSPGPLNENMEKVEEALAAQENLLSQTKEEIYIYKRLGSYVSADGNVSAAFDLSGVDLSQYTELKLWVGGITATAGELFLRLNEDSSGKYISSSGSANAQNQYTLLTLNTNAYPTSFTVQIVDEPRGRVHFLATVQSYQTINGGAGYSTGYGMYTGCGLNGVQSIQVYGSQTLNAGIELVLYGIKK